MIRPLLFLVLVQGLVFPRLAGAVETNVALYKPTSGDETAGFPTSYGNDGSTLTFTQASNPQPAPNNPYWMVDLTGVYHLTRVELVDRAGCCAPNRLNGAVIRFYDAGEEQVGEPLTVSGLPDNNPAETATLSWNNGGAGWQGVAFVRIDGVSPDFQFAEFRAFAEDGAVAGETTNIAVGRPVTTSGATLSGYPATNVVDGDRNTFSHPAVSTGTQGFYYQIDLGKVTKLDRIVVSGRADGCCPERLSNYRVALVETAGGVAVWTANMRTNGSNPGVAGEDVLRASTGTGTFSGRYVRISNLAVGGYMPQIAEVEVFPAALPSITEFAVTAGNITAGGNPSLPTETTLRWAAGNFTALSISPDVGDLSAASGGVTVKPSTTTTYTLTAVNEAGSVTATVRVAVDEVTLPPRLTEFLADNTRSLRDSRGERGDWIEIHNPNLFALSVAGYFLTDDPAAPAKWRFPELVILAEGYLIVWADGLDMVDTASGQAHTNFSLSRAGEYLALTARDGVTPVTRYPAAYPAPQRWPEQAPDISYGLTEAGAEAYFAVPTPGEQNGPGAVGYIRAVDVATGRGFYETPQAVTLSCPTPGTEIRYTTDGKEPTATTGTVYTAPVEITTTRVLRAAAFREGWVPSPAATHTYVFPAAVAASSVMRATVTRHATYGPMILRGLTALPSFSLVTHGAVNGNTQVKASVEFLSPAGETQFQEYCGVRNFGGAYTDFPKKNFRLYFSPEHGVTKLRQPLFDSYGRGGIGIADSFDQLELRTGSHDMKQRGFYLSNTFTDDTMLDMGNISPHGRYAHLYLNGVYHGVYHLRERWQGDMLSDYLGGKKEDYEAINGNWNVGGWADPGTPYDGDGSVWTRIKSLRSDYVEVRRWIDIQSYVDFMLMFMFGNSEDEYRIAGPTTPDVGMRWWLNDADGFTRSTGSRTARSSPGRQSGDGPGSVFSMLVKQGHPDFKMLLADRIQFLFFNDGPMARPRNVARLQARISEFEPAIAAETARWGASGENDSWPTPAGWISAKNSYLNSVLPTRSTSVVTEYRSAGFFPTLAAPVFTPYGGDIPAGEAVGVSNPTGTVYFTVDGSDPRLPGGAVSPTAIPHDPANPPAALTFTKNTWLRARAKNGAVWSALNQAYYTVAGTPAVRAGDLVLTEIHYHPAPGGGGEFIEFLNVADHAVNLRGVRLASGPRFSFSDTFDTVLSAGQRLVIVKDLLAFRRVHGPEPRVAGLFMDGLNSLGEILSLEDAAGAPLLTVEYQTGGVWPSAPDGGGSTLVFAGGNPTDPANWRASTAPEGTPLGDDSVPFAGVPEADANGNGIPDLLDYVSGPGGPALTLRWNAEGGLTVICPRAAGADAAILALEESTDGMTWSDATDLYALASREATPGGELLHFHRTETAAGSRLFLRRRATLR